MHVRSSAVVCGVFLLAASAGAQQRFQLTIDSIMRGPELVGYEPSAQRWSGDSQKIYFEWKQASDPLLKALDTYEVNRDGSGLRKLTEEEAKLAPPALGERSKDKTKTAYVRDGDLFVYDHSTGHTRQITKTADVESNPHFTRDGKRIWFTRANNLYVLTLENGLLEELTDIRAASAGPGEAAVAGSGLGVGRGSAAAAAVRTNGEPEKGTDSQEFLKKEERELLDVVNQRARIREEQEARKKRENPRKPMTLEARQTVTSLVLSPDEKIVIATILEPGKGTKNTVVPNFVTESGYTEDISGRNKVGDVQGQTRLALVGVTDGAVKWVDHGQKLPRAPETQQTEKSETATDKARTEQSTPPRTGDAQRPPQTQERDVTLLRPEWSEDGTKAVMMARAADNKDRWILALDAATGKTRIIFTEHDEAWVGGPGTTTLGWMKNDRDIFFQSEREGYSHLYTVSYGGGQPRQLTSGKWEVSGARLSEDLTRFYLTTNEGDPANVHLYSMSADGGVRTRITAMPGNHHAVLSPDEKSIADIYSYTNKPPELFVMDNRPGAEEKKLTSSPIPEFWSYPWLDAPTTHFTARDGVAVPVRVYKPAKFERGGPAVIFVHGAGYLQNVHHWWSSYYHEYMFHHILVEHGYLVIDIDYRGSAGYGRDWRTAIYRHMGGKDLDDHVDAAKWLVTQYGVNPKRIGLYGGSYGGFITLMALFTQPDVFAAGAALRPVTDWAHYNHPYTANILNLPQKDAEAYRKSSPIYFAAGLKGALLICHGMVDVNVHFQDTARLVQKLIELRKTNWELAMFPVEDHGFVQPTSWADEYKRIFALFEKNLR
jgi:dipeptidyl aminopeptidase/acylaminoacyl peptidase